MEEILKAPVGFLPSEAQFFFETGELNGYQRSAYADTFGYFQGKYQVYRYMQVNRDRKYVVHIPKGHPLMWASYKACSYDETGHVTEEIKEITPCKAYTKLGWCHDDFFDSAYKAMIEFTSGGDVQLDAEGEKVFQLLLDEILTNNALATRLLLTVGQLYDPETITFEDNVDQTIQDIWTNTTSTCRGWVKLFQDLASGGYPWLNMSHLLPADSVTASTFTGDALAIFDGLLDGARPALLNLINMGGSIRASDGTPFVPLFICSGTIYNAVVKKEKELNASLATNGVRITKERETGANGVVQRQYYIDDMPVVPIFDINGYDKYIKGGTHFAGIIASGNIQLGTNFDSLPLDIENTDVAIMIEKDNRISSPSYGKYHMLSHALFATALADAEFAVAAAVHAVEEEVEPA